MNTARDSKYTYVTVRMPADLVKQIDELAMDAMRSRSAQVIMLLKQALGACKSAGK